MITCVLHYTIASDKIAEFEWFAQEWMRPVNKHGGEHHGYFLLSEGASDQTLALFSFESLAAYELPSPVRQGPGVTDHYNAHIALS